MFTLFNIAEILTLHRQCIVDWKNKGVVCEQQHFFALVEENHAFNYQLWHAEDRARRDDKGHEFVYQAKRDIDYFNQQRNNRMEAMDAWLYNTLQPVEPTQCPVHSETPGMMIDRLSILALKAYHMHVQMERKEVEETHRQNCRQKWQMIVSQKKQLAACLEQLLSEVQGKKRTFRVYHQFKMYNDPSLNPELYR